MTKWRNHAGASRTDRPWRGAVLAMRVRRGRSTTIVAFALTVAMLVPVASGYARAAGAAETPDPTSRNAQCIEGYESLLPGLYYARRARYHYVCKRYLRTLRMLKEAAFWANKRAQYTLGVMFFGGSTSGYYAKPPARDRLACAIG